MSNIEITTNDAITREQLRDSLNLKDVILAEANLAIGEYHELTELRERVLALPHVAAECYRAANEAADNVTRIVRRMNAVERGHRKQMRAAEESGELGKMNDAKRADHLADLLEADAEYQLLVSLCDEADSLKRDMTLTGDEYRRELYNLRGCHETEMRLAVIHAEAHTQRAAVA